MNKSAQPDEDADWSQATPGVDYLCFDLYMRMQNPRKIYITETSALTPLDSVLTRDNETNKSSNPSTYGNFSKDCMIGATRFSANSADGTENKLKWIHSDGFLSDFCCGNLILLRNRFNLLLQFAMKYFIRNTITFDFTLFALYQLYY